MNIKSVIQEEVKLFLTENQQYQDTDKIDFRNINLYNEYNELNQQLFGGKLPKVMMKWSSRKTSLGHVNFRVERRSTEIIINHLAISNFYAMTYRVFLNTLAHEMIHIEQKEKGYYEEIRYNPHGNFFRSEAHRINNMGLGYNITKSNEEQLGVSDKTKNSMKSLIGIILNIDGKYYISVTTPNVFNAQHLILFRIFEKLVTRGKYKKVEITVVETQNPELIKYRVAKSFNSVAYAPLSDALFEQLLEDKIIKNVVFERDKEPVMSEETSTDSTDWVSFDVI